MKNQGFKILIATDLHLGYKSKDPIRESDSITTLEEILQLAKYEDVDFILLGGDLFHENKPSYKIICQTIFLLRKYCLGDKKIHFQVENAIPADSYNVSSLNFHDDRLKIGIPVFSIHGNHDDPIGADSLCPLDILSNSGLVNYFGKSPSSDSIALKPFILRKEETILALYGLGAINEARFQKLIQENSLNPLPSPEGAFNIFVLHQNRYSRSSQANLEDFMKLDFADLVILGHEHESFMDPIQIKSGGFFIQPGSTIITSLCKGESHQKNVGIITIKDKSFNIKKVPLLTPRRLYFKSVPYPLKSEPIINLKEFEEFAHKHIKKLLESAAKEKASNLSLPLIRLKIKCDSDFSSFNNVKFGMEYVEKTANPKNLVLVVKNELETVETNFDGDFTIKDDYKIEQYISDYISQNECSKKFKIIPIKNMAESVNNFVVKNDKESISFFVDSFQEDIVADVEVTTEKDVEENVIKYVEKFKMEEYTPKGKSISNVVEEKENAKGPQKRKRKTETSN